MTKRTDPTAALQKGRRERSTTARKEILERLTTDFQPVTKRPSDGAIVVYRDLPGGFSWDGLKELTLARLEENHIGYDVAVQWSACLDTLANRLYSQEAKRVLVDDSAHWGPHNLVQSLDSRLPRTEVLSADDVEPRDAAQFDAALVPVQAVIAQTGSLVIATASRRRLAASLLPRTVYGFCTTRQVVPDFGAWVDAEGHQSEMHTVLVSGPSRTADIEKQLVMGVHGPWNVSVFFVQGR